MYSLPKSHSDKIKLIAICVLLAAAYVLFHLHAAAIGDVGTGYGDIVQLRMGSKSLSTSQIDAMLEKRKADNGSFRYLGWSQKDEMLYYYGDNSGAFNLILDNGCALSESEAYRYFGTTEGILGETVVINGESYVLEKLLRGHSVPAVLKVSEKSEDGFDVLNIISGVGETASVSELALNYKVTGDIVIVYGPVIKFFEAMGKLALWAAFLIAAFGVLKAVCVELNAMARKLIIFCGLLATGFICWLLIGSPVFIPDSFIPTRWSEFEFWAATFDHYGSVVSYYFSMKTYAPDLIFRAYIIKSLAFALISAVSVILAGAIAVRLFRERGIKIGVDNLKKYHEMLRGKYESRS